MHKKIIAGAILGVLSGAVYAQSSVTIYGVVDAGLVVERQGLATNKDSGNRGQATTKLDGGINNGSRLGFKGSEDLGRGLSAIFTIESGFSPDTGQAGQGGALFGRQAFVGLTGGFGTVKLGRFYTVFDNVLGATDAFATGLAGRSNNLVGSASNTAVAGYAGRFNNLIQYSTPDLGGFTADVQYSFGEAAGSASKARNVGLGLSYVRGPLAVRAAHQRSNDQKSSASAPGVLSSTGIPVFEHNVNHTIVGATYDFSVAKLHAAYAKNQRSVIQSNVQYQSDDVLIGVSVPLGAGKLVVSYVHKKDKSTNIANYAGDADQLGAAYLFELSKRTTLYTAYAVVRNKGKDALYTVGTATTDGSGTQAFNLGVRHTF